MRETLECDVLVIGAGASGLSCAIALAQALESHNKKVSSGLTSGPMLRDAQIWVLEKGPSVGAHSVSGAILDPVILQRLFPNALELGFPRRAVVKQESLLWLTRSHAWSLPVVPPSLQNQGYWLVSLSEMNRWLGQQAENLGVQVLPGFSAVDLVWENDQLVGVITDDKGLLKDGQKAPNYQPGFLIKSKLVVFAEGPKGSLFKKLLRHLNLPSPKDLFELGVKEVIQLPKGQVAPGLVWHTLGYPFDDGKGGAFIYTYDQDQLSLGVVVSLNSRDPFLDAHAKLQEFKQHPWVQQLIEGGEVIAYGAKTIPSGGWFNLPPLYGNGWLVIGDSAGFVDLRRLKGIHLAMASGYLAAQTALKALVQVDFSAKTLKSYEESVIDPESLIYRALWTSRNHHSFLNWPLGLNFLGLGFQEITNGHCFGLNFPPSQDDAQTTAPVVEVWGTDHPQPSWSDDGKLFFNKLSSVYLTGTRHPEEGVNHLKLQNPEKCQECYSIFKSPCTYFCPAQVYEIVSSESGNYTLKINFSNCIHCKTCDIKCPYENIDWQAPEGGMGPNYSLT